MKRGIFGGYGRDTVEKFISATPNGMMMSVFTIVENSKGSGDCKIFCIGLEGYRDTSLKY